MYLGLALTLRESDIPYTSRIAPEDWIIFWAFNSYSKYIQVKNNITSAIPKRSNKFDIAPKFIGRVNSIFKDKRVSDPNTGKMEIVYEVTANGFTELDSAIYYNTAIGFNYPTAQQGMKDFSNSIQNFVTKGAVKPHEAIPELFNVCLGLGPGERFKGVEGFKTRPSPNEAYFIPKTIAHILMDSPASKTTYADLMVKLVGLQVYSSSGDSSFRDSIAGVLPSVSTSGFIPLLRDLSGKFVPQPIHFNNQPVWSILNTYLNPPINEMYTCLRVDNSGYVMPTLICRQIPFSSKKFVLNNPNIATTFTSLPRWEIDDSLLLQFKVGRSNATRLNYIQLSGTQPFGESTTIQKANAYNIFLPVVDVADIKRAGLNAKIGTIGAFYVPTDENAQENGRFWNKLMADILFGSHLKFTGTAIVKRY